MKKVFILCAIILLLTALNGVNHTITFNAAELEITKDKIYDVLYYEGLLPSNEIGAPNLPVKTLKFIIPTGMDVSQVNISKTSLLIEDSLLVVPTQPPVRLSIDYVPGPFVEPDPEFYSINADYPAEPVIVRDQSYFDGCYRIVTVDVYPFQYNPVTMELIANSSINFSFDYVTSTEPALYRNTVTTCNYESAKTILEALVENSEDIDTYMIQPNTNRIWPDVDKPAFVIISPNYLIPALSEFVEWKEMLGFNMCIKSLETLLTEYPNGDDFVPGDCGINDDAGRVRKYLYEQWRDNGLEHVLLVGDETAFPVRYGWDNCWNPPDSPYDYDVVSDLYFQDFNGAWNLDGINPLGHWCNDNPLDLREITGGRLLVENNDAGRQEIINWTEKVKTYENYPGYGDVNYLENAHFSSADFMASNIHNYYDSYQQPLVDLYNNAGMNVTELKENPLFGTLGTPNGSATIDSVNSGNGYLHFSLHGAKFAMSPATTDDNCNPRYHLSSLESYDDAYAGGNIVIPETGNSFENMNQDGKYAIVNAVSCSIANYVDPRQNMSIARAYTMYLTRRGGPVFVGNTNLGSCAKHDVMRNAFMQLTLGRDSVHRSRFNIRAGEALDYSGRDFAYTLFGDPSLRLWREKPEYLNVSVDQINPRLVRISKTSNNNPFPRSTYGRVMFYNSQTQQECVKSLQLTTNESITASDFDFNYVNVIAPDCLPSFVRFAFDNETISNESINYDLVVESGRTAYLSGNICLDDISERNAKIIVEEGATLHINNNCVLTADGFTRTNGQIVDKIVMQGNSIDVYGTIIIHEGAQLISDGSWDGINIYNSSSLSLNNVTIGGCTLSKEEGDLIITNSNFIDASIKAKFGNLTVSDCTIDGRRSFKGIEAVDCSNVTISNTDIVEARTGIYLNTCEEITIDNCVISDNFADGISLFKSGSLSTEINNCTVFNNRVNGISIYDSRTKIVNCSITGNWRRGIFALRESNVEITRDPESEYDQHSIINDNYWEEITFIENCILDLQDNQNKIIDNCFNTGSWDELLINCPDMINRRKFTGNFWGYLDGHGNPILPYSNRFYPPELNPQPDSAGFLLSPVWDLVGTVPDPPDGGDEILYHQAVELAESGSTSIAIQKYKMIIDQYPGSNFAGFAASDLFDIYEDFNELKTYYTTEPNLHYDGNISKLTAYLENYCDIEIGNYEEAIEYFESIIDSSDSEIDVAMAGIEAGYIYCLMETNGERAAQYIGQKPELKPISRQSYIDNVDNILSNLLTERKIIKDSSDDDISKFPELVGNYPNPFNPETAIRFSIPEESTIKIDIYNLKGQKVKTILNERMEKGYHEAVWKGLDSTGKSAGSGVYFFRLNVNGKTIDIGKCVLLK